MDEAYKKAVFPDACLSRCASPENCVCKEKMQAALKEAHGIRRFEINLYWRRSLYFWGFQVAFFPAYTLAFKNVEISPSDAAKVESLWLILSPVIAIAVLGLLVSFLWFFLEKGSKAWQENWEHHIDQLEDEFTGKLHKVVLGKENEFYSVTKINKVFIFVIGFAWLFFLFLPLHLYDLWQPMASFICRHWFMFLIGILFSLWLLYISIKSSFPNGGKHGMTETVEGIGENKKINIYYRWKNGEKPQLKRRFISWLSRHLCFLGIAIVLSLFLGVCCFL